MSVTYADRRGAQLAADGPIHQAPIGPSRDQIRQAANRLRDAGGMVSSNVAASWIEAALESR